MKSGFVLIGNRTWFQQAQCVESAQHIILVFNAAPCAGSSSLSRPRSQVDNERGDGTGCSEMQARDDHGIGSKPPRINSESIFDLLYSFGAQPQQHCSFTGGAFCQQCDQGYPFSLPNHKREGDFDKPD